MVDIKAFKALVKEARENPSSTRAALLTEYHSVRDALALGVSLSAISRSLGVSRQAVARAWSKIEEDVRTGKIHPAAPSSVASPRPMDVTRQRDLSTPLPASSPGEQIDQGLAGEAGPIFFDKLTRGRKS